MQKLIELTGILNRKVTQQIHIIGDSKFAGSLMETFYQAVLEKKVKTDAEAAMLLYGNPEITAKYRNLKSALRKRLLNTVYFININEETDGKWAVAKAECWRLWTQSRFVSQSSGLLNAVDLQKKALKKALEYECTDIAVMAAKSLRSFYAMKKRNSKEFERYDAIFKQQREFEYWENEADEHYQRLVLDFAAKSTSISPLIKEAVEKVLDILLPQQELIPTIIFNVRLFDIRLLSAMGTYNYREAKKIAIEGLAFYAQHKHVANSNISNLLLHKLVCHIQLTEYEEGKTTAETCKNLLDDGSFNWFKAQEYFFMLALHTGEYQQAYRVHWQLEQHESFPSFWVYFRELWVLYHAYLYVLVKLGKVEPDKNDSRFDNFRMSRFMNEIPTLSTDKKGMNIPILIAQMLLEIIEKNYDAALEHIEAIGKYQGRYAKDDEHFRSNCFIKMLQQIPKGYFKAKNVGKRVVTYLEDMATVAINFSNQSHETEVLPFPVMWRWIIMNLK